MISFPTMNTSLPCSFFHLLCIYFVYLFITDTFYYNSHLFSLKFTVVALIIFLFTHSFIL